MEWLIFDKIDIKTKTLLHVREPLGNIKSVPPDTLNETQNKQKEQRTCPTAQLRTSPKPKLVGKVPKLDKPSARTGRRRAKTAVTPIRRKEGMVHQALQNKNVREVLTLKHRCPRIRQQAMWESPGKKQTTETGLRRNPKSQ